MARPTDWTPLGYDADPVPGDPETISREAAHLTRVEQQIADQVAALRTIAGSGDDGALQGHYSEKIRSSASDLAGQLAKVEGRYREVSSALNQWVPDLEHAQSQSLTALNEAEAPYQKLNQAVILPSGPDLTAAQKQSIQDYHTSMDRAQADLDAAKARLTRAVGVRDQQAARCASAINNAIDDGVKDSWWDHVKDWVDRNAGWLRTAANVLGWIATALAVLALLIPGLNIVALAFLGAMLLIHTMLAAAGDGSWLDVGLDVLALATLGTGKLVTAMARETVTGVEDAIATAAGRAAARTALRDSSALRAARARVAASQGAKPWERAAARAQLNSLKTQVVRTARRTAARAIRNEPLPKVSLIDRAWAGGDKEMAQYTARARSWAGRFPEARGVQDVLQTVNKARATGFLAWTANNAFDSLNHAGVTSGFGPYRRLQDLTTTHGGLTTGQAKDVLTALQFGPVAPVAIGFRAVWGG